MVYWSWRGEHRQFSAGEAMVLANSMQAAGGLCVEERGGTRAPPSLQKAAWWEEAWQG